MTLILTFTPSGFFHFFHLQYIKLMDIILRPESHENIHFSSGYTGDNEGSKKDES